MCTAMFAARGVRADRIHSSGKEHEMAARLPYQWDLSPAYACRMTAGCMKMRIASRLAKNGVEGGQETG